MQGLCSTEQLTARLVDALYVEAMVLTDEVRAYFDETGRSERDRLPPVSRIGFSCESLKITTRLMHVLAWLLTRRAVEAGEMSMSQACDPARRLGRATASDTTALTPLPATARQLVEASLDLYARVERLERDLDSPIPTASPARGLLSRLERAF